MRLRESDTQLVQTDAEGEYRAEDLAPGDYQVHVEEIPDTRNFDCQAEGHDGEVTVEAGEERDGVGFVCDLQ